MTQAEEDAEDTAAFSSTGNPKPEALATPQPLGSISEAPCQKIQVLQ